MPNDPRPTAHLRDGIHYVVLADLVGSTSYTTAMGNDAGKARKYAFESAAKQALEHTKPHNSGIFVKTIGDAVLLAFDHFPDIVQWYLEFDGQLILNLTQTDPMKARLCVHVGEVRFRNDDIDGLAVDQICKVENTAKKKAPTSALILTDLAKQIAGPALFPRQVVLEPLGPVDLGANSHMDLYQIIVKADIAFLFEKQSRDKLRERKETE